MSKLISEINVNPKPMFYACVLECLRKTALQSGYALAVHGSCASDLDLIAIKWSDNCQSPDELARQFVEKLSHYRFADETITELTSPTRRYKNQIHYSIPIIGTWYVDFTVIEDV